MTVKADEDLWEPLIKTTERTSVQSAPMFVARPEGGLAIVGCVTNLREGSSEALNVQTIPR